MCWPAAQTTVIHKQGSLISENENMNSADPSGFQARNIFIQKREQKKKKISLHCAKCGELCVVFCKKKWKPGDVLVVMVVVQHWCEIRYMSLRISSLCFKWCVHKWGKTLVTPYLSASGGTVPWMMIISPGCRPPGMGPVYGITWGGELTLEHRTLETCCCLTGGSWNSTRFIY